MNQEERTEDQLIRAPYYDVVLQVGPGFKARSTPCSRCSLSRCASLLLLSLSPFFCSSLSPLPPSFFLGSLPLFLLYLSLQLDHLTRACPYTYIYTSRTHVRAARARRSLQSSPRFLAIFLFFSPALLSFFLPRARNNVVVGRGDSSSVGDKRPIKGTVEPQHRRITTCSARSTKGGRRDTG